MDFKGFFENLKEKIISLYELIKDYCSENKRNAILIGSLIVLVLLLLILLLCLPKHKKSDAPVEKPIVLHSIFPEPVAKYYNPCESLDHQELKVFL